MCKLLRIRKTRTTAYHPAGNGQGKNLDNTLRASSKLNCIGMLKGGMNKSVRASWHIETAFIGLIYGKEMKLPLDIMMGQGRSQTQNVEGAFALPT